SHKGRGRTFLPLPLWEGAGGGVLAQAEPQKTPGGKAWPAKFPASRSLRLRGLRTMSLFTWANWPLLVICAGMIAAAIIDWWKFKVPNRLTFPLIISGWVLGLCNNFGLEAGIGGIGASLTGTF